MTLKRLRIPFESAESGLLLPSYFVDRQLKGDPDLPYIGVYVTMHELKRGVPTSVRSILAKARKYCFEDLILNACRVNLFLARHSQTNPRLQADLGRALLEDKYLIPLVALQNDHSNKKRDSTASRPVFTKMLVLHFLKQMYLGHNEVSCNYIDSKTNPKSVTDFGYLLLAFSDSLGAKVKRAKKSNPKAAAMELVRNYFLTNSEDLRHLLRRYYELLFLIPRTIDGRPHVGDTISSLFWKASKVSLRNYFSLGFGILTRFAGVNYFAPVKNMNPNEDFILEWDTYFSNLRIPKTQVERMIGMFALPSTEVRDQFRNRLEQSNSSFDYDMDPFSNYPLLEIGQRRYTVSERHFFEDKFTHHVIFTVLNYLEKPVDRRREFKLWWGNVVQEYVWKIFRRYVAIPTKFSPYDVFYDVPYKKGEKRATDIMCFLPSTGELFMFEVTSSHMQYSVLTQSDNWDLLMKDVNRIVIEKAIQVDKTIAAIKSGQIKLVPADRPDVEVTVSDIKLFRPFIVTLKAFPGLPFIWNGHPDLWNGIYQVLSDKNRLTAEHIAPLALITVDEFEYLTELSRCGTNFFDVLRKWSADANLRVWPLKGFLLENFENELRKAEEKFGLEDEGAFEMIKSALLGPEVVCDQKLPDSSLA